MKPLVEAALSAPSPIFDSIYAKDGQSSILSRERRERPCRSQRLDLPATWHAADHGPRSRLVAGIFERPANERGRAHPAARLG